MVLEGFYFALCSYRIRAERQSFAMHDKRLLQLRRRNSDEFAKELNGENEIKLWSPYIKG